MSAREQRSLGDRRSAEYDDRYDDEYDDDFGSESHDRRKKRRMVPLVAGVIAIPVGLTLAGALVLNTVGEDGPDAANGTSAVGEIGENSFADDSLAPKGEEDDDFFDEPTAAPEHEEPSGDSGTLSAQATATFSPKDPEGDDESTGGGGSGDGGGDDGGSRGGGGESNATNAGGPMATEVVNLVNSERSANGCGPVHVDGQLTSAAQEHSEDMAARDYMAHQNPDGEGPSERAIRHGYNSLGAENVAKGQQNAQQVMDAWMNSEGHRDNILNCDLQAIGVGEADRAWTQKFGFE